jgi:hypothetical protein
MIQGVWIQIPIWIRTNNLLSGSGYFNCVLQVLREQQEARREREQLRIRMMNADPFDLEAQRLIAKVRFKIFLNFLRS